MGNIAISGLELLVKLASLGAAGISIYAIYAISKEIFNLPNDVSKVKASLLNRFMGTCVILAIVCGVSSWVNARFTYNQVVDANEKADKMEQLYDQTEQQVNTLTDYIQADINSLRTQLRTDLSPENIIRIQSQLDRTEARLNQLHVKPLDEVVKEIGPERRRTPPTLFRRDNR